MSKLDDLIYDLELEIDDSEDEHFEYKLGLETALGIVKCYKKLENDNCEEE